MKDKILEERVKNLEGLIKRFVKAVKEKDTVAVDVLFNQMKEQANGNNKNHW